VWWIRVTVGAWVLERVMGISKLPYRPPHESIFEPRSNAFQDLREKSDKKNNQEYGNHMNLPLLHSVANFYIGCKFTEELPYGVPKKHKNKGYENYEKCVFF
jgi:hypothetical protein